MELIKTTSTFLTFIWSWSWNVKQSKKVLRCWQGGLELERLQTWWQAEHLKEPGWVVTSSWAASFQSTRRARGWSCGSPVRSSLSSDLFQIWSSLWRAALWSRSSEAGGDALCCWQVRHSYENYLHKWTLFDYSYSLVKFCFNHILSCIISDKFVF